MLFCSESSIIEVFAFATVLTQAIPCLMFYFGRLRTVAAVKLSSQADQELIRDCQKLKEGWLQVCVACLSGWIACHEIASLW